MSEPTSLDYQEAYMAIYPDLAVEGIRLQDVQDAVLKVVDRAARLRCAERKRVKNAFLKLATSLDRSNQVPLDPAVVVDLIRETSKEIR